jgi:3',5'-cyclic AMP phosphodiesterase CpdA
MRSKACCASSNKPPLTSLRALLAAACAAAAAGCLTRHDAAPAAPPTYTVYAAGDIAYCDKKPALLSDANDTAKLVEAGLAASADAAVLLLGDNVYQRGSAAEFRDCYAPTWGRFKARTYPAPGNHEYYTPGATGYFDYFGSAAGPGYYSVNLGAWHVVSLNSNLKGAAQQAQLDWLRQDLAASGARCTLAYWHHPLYSSGWHGSIATMRPVWDLLYQRGAELVLSGHDHTYERFLPQDANGRRDDVRGIRQFVVGTGGAYYTPFKLPLENSKMRDNSRFGVLKLVLRADSYEWEFLEASYDGFPNGNKADRGAGKCH